MIVLMMNVLFFICQFFKITIVAHMAFEKRSFFRASSGIHITLQVYKAIIYEVLYHPYRRYCSTSSAVGLEVYGAKS